ncbi:hypothetical protein CCACVL1_16615 [Corchorus capsularis]|uniref:J domain-containing protein n=1 Tax=Corchorus capsularis TaxID=210143 RepID=A0A1R3HWA4_COCAP|nr:hypothetical protein CCACVL1_16615 [Corchorus capsularis]
MDVDHYRVLGLPSGEEGANLTAKEITKAYREKARDLHPDKRKDDPNAHENFIKLKSSYEILVDEKARKLFDDLLRVKRDQERRFAQQDAKRRKMTSDLEERERAAFAPDPAVKAKEEEERIARKLKDEIARIRAMHANKGASTGAGSGSGLNQENVGREGNSGGVGLDREKVLKVSWEKIGEDYTAGKLRELFSRFGEVEDVMIKSSKKKRSAIVVMATKEAAVAATGSVSGSLSNPLLVLPFKPAIAAEFAAPKKAEETDGLSNLVGAALEAYEDAVFQKLRKAAEKQRK